MFIPIITSDYRLFWTNPNDLYWKIISNHCNLVCSDFFLENRNYKISPCRSRAEKTLICNTLCNTLFEKVPDIKGLRPNTETQKSHREGEAIVSPSLFRETHKGFQRVQSSPNKGKWNDLSVTHFFVLIFLKINFYLKTLVQALKILLFCLNQL